MSMTVRDLAADVKASGTGTCGHGHRTILGANGQTEYLRCGCGTILVVQDGRTWFLRPAPT